MNNKVYEMVTNNIIAQLEKGVVPWVKAWSHGMKGCVSHSTGKPYSLLNQLLLPLEGEYITFKQCVDEGGKVKKGEKSSIVVFWKWLEKPTGEKDDEGNDIIKKIPYLHYYSVFHISQCEGIKAKYSKPIEERHHEPIKVAESLISHYIEREGIKLERESLSNEAYYQPFGDFINLPALRQFEHCEEFYSTAFHEMVHSTGHEKRLNRKLTGCTSRTRTDYSKEELVAEIGSAMLCNVLGINSDFTDMNSTAYVQGWLKALKNDVKMVVSASGKAEKACDFILDGFTPDDTPDTPDETEKVSKGAKVNKGVNSALKSLINAKGLVNMSNTMTESNGITYACNGHALAKTTECTEFRHDKDLTFDTIQRLDGLLNNVKKEACADVNLPEHKAFKQAVSEFKKSVKCKKVGYVLNLEENNKVVLDAKYLEIVLHCGCTTAKGTNSKSPVYFAGDTTEAIVLPIHSKVEHNVGEFIVLE